MVKLKDKAEGRSSAPIIDLLLTAYQEKEQTTDFSQNDKLSGKIEAYQEILIGSNLTKDELQIFLAQKSELLHLGCRQ